MRRSSGVAAQDKKLSGGLNRFMDEKFIAYTQNMGLAGEFATAYFQDREGDFWFGTRDGLSRLKDGKFTNYTTKDGLSSNLISSIHGSADGALWVATKGGGLNRLKQGKITNYIDAKNGGRATVPGADRSHRGERRRGSVARIVPQV